MPELHEEERDAHFGWPVALAALAVAGLLYAYEPMAGMMVGGAFLLIAAGFAWVAFRYSERPDSPGAINRRIWRLGANRRHAARDVSEM